MNFYLLDWPGSFRAGNYLLLSAAKYKMNTQLLHNETPVRDGAANLQRGVETVGGWLFLTDQRLIFEPHSRNVQKQVEVVNLSDVAFVHPAWTLFFGLVPLFPNSILLSSKRGADLRFTVSNKTAWIEAIQGLL
ncbi:GRAM domain-containing protein [Aquisphaera giovannonii]|uniref:GRAM domain-containing protein n=1 Tax=Aquisphaera giovannonii TaxID=406548 RepID=UPI001AEF99D2|nr:GRAM domain-containing protein [Aquisphaera giovannonii]